MTTQIILMILCFLLGCATTWNLAVLKLNADINRGTIEYEDKIYNVTLSNKGN